MVLIQSAAFAEEQPDDIRVISAASMNDVDRLTQLIEDGGDPNADNGFPGGTALCEAVRFEAYDAADLLIKSGADLDFPCGYGDTSTPLGMALQTDDARLLDLLLTSGEDPETIFGRGALAKPAMCHAISLGALNAVRVLLKAGADPSTKCNRYDSAICSAVSEQHSGIIPSLIESGADVDADCGVLGTALERAVRTEQANVLEALLASNRDRWSSSRSFGAGLVAAVAQNNTSAVRSILLENGDVDQASGEGFLRTNALCSAASANSVEMVSILLTAGASLDAKCSSFSDARTLIASSKSPEMRQLLNGLAASTSSAVIAREDTIAARETVFCRAVRAGDIAAIQEMIEGGGSWDQLCSDLSTPVRLAFTSNNANALKLFLQTGLDPNSTPTVGQGIDYPLCEAELNNWDEIVPLLLEFGADPNIVCLTNQSPLMVAVQHRRTQRVSGYLLSKADPNMVSEGSIATSPLCSAVRARELEITKLLLRHGSNADLGCGPLENPLVVALKNNDLQMISVLIEGGANAGGAVPVTGVSVASFARSREAIDALGRVEEYAPSIDASCSLASPHDQTKSPELRVSSVDGGVAYVQRNGSFVITITESGSVQLLSAADGRLYHRFTGHRGAPVEAGFVSDTKLVWAIDELGELIVWDTLSGREHLRRTFGNIDFSGVASHEESVVSVRDAEEGTLIVQIRQPLRSAYGLQHRSRYFVVSAVSCTDLAEIEILEDDRLFDGGDYAPLSRSSIAAISKRSRSVVFSRKGAGAHKPNLEFEDGWVPAQLDAFGGGQFLVIALADEIAVQSFASSAPGQIQIWDLTKNERVSKVDLKHIDLIRSMKVSSELAELVLSGSNSVERLVFSKDFSTVKDHFAENGLLAEVDFGAQQGCTLLGTVFGLFSARLEGSERCNSFPSTDYSIRSLEIFNNGRRLLIVGSTVELWDLENGTRVNELRHGEPYANDAAVLADDETVATVGDDGVVRLWSGDTGLAYKRPLKLSDCPLWSISATVDHASLFVARLSDDLLLLPGGENECEETHDGFWQVDVEPGNSLVSNVAGPPQRDESYSKISVSPDGRTLVALGDFGNRHEIWRRPHIGDEFLSLGALWEAGPLQFADEVSLEFDPAGDFVIAATARNFLNDRDGAYLLNNDTFDPEFGISGSESGVTSIAADPENYGRFFLGTNAGNIVRFDAATRETSLILEQAGSVSAIEVEDDLLIVGNQSGRITIWNLQTKETLIDLVLLNDGQSGWATVLSGGRFDSNALERLPGVNWLMPNREGLELQAIETFFREYFTPGLFGKILRGETVPVLPALEDLDRTQPKLEIRKIELEEDNNVAVTVAAQSVASNIEGGSYSGVEGLRLMRNGQMVGEALLGNDAIGRRAGETREVVFSDIQLPGDAVAGDIEFSAYAFSEAGIKSTTVRREYDLPNLASQPRRAFVLSVGVNNYDDSTWDLSYAAADAREYANRFSRGIEISGELVETVSVVSLISDNASTLGEARATSRNIEAVLRVLSGEAIDASSLARIPGLEEFSRARPDDVVIIAFSGHGYAAEDGQFYFFPQDIPSRTGEDVTPELLERAISSRELRALVSSIDAGQFVMIIDACNSGASVTGMGGFRPGPLGSREFGQLAYDKKMTVLAASSANSVALESGETGHGLLTYALMKEGVEGGLADTYPADGTVSLLEVLRYGEARVPELYSEISRNQFEPLYRSGRGLIPILTDPENDHSATGAFQPQMFNFSEAQLAEVALK